MFDVVKYLLFLGHLALVTLGLITTSPEMVMLGNFTLLVSNIFWAMGSPKENFAFIIINLVMFVFILGRPVIQIIRGETWFFYGEDELRFVLLALWLALVGLFLGAILFGAVKRHFTADDERVSKKPLIAPEKIEERAAKNRALRRASLVLFGVSLAIVLYMGWEILAFRSTHSYVEYFVSFQTHVPYPLRVISTFMPFAMCMFLAASPTKRQAAVVLGLFILTAVPNLINGTRNPIILNALFAVSYFIIRDAIDGKGTWVEKKELAGAAVLVPLTVIFMFSYAYIRSGLTIPSLGLDALWAFIYQQGTTFDVLSMGYISIPDLPAGKFYTFGGMIDYVAHGSLAQALFGAIDLGGTNSVIMGTESNNFAHNMSYLMHPGYLEGNGWGSSFILEAYVDFGYLGIVVYSMLLGALLVGIIDLCKTNFFVFIIIQIILMRIFFLPRDKALGFIEPLFTASFLLTIVLCLAIIAYTQMRIEEGG